MLENLRRKPLRFLPWVRVRGCADQEQLTFVTGDETLLYEQRTDIDESQFWSVIDSWIRSPEHILKSIWKAEGLIIDGCLGDTMLEVTNCTADLLEAERERASHFKPSLDNLPIVLNLCFPWLPIYSLAQSKDSLQPTGSTIDGIIVARHEDNLKEHACNAWLPGLEPAKATHAWATLFEFGILTAKLEAQKGKKCQDRITPTEGKQEFRNSSCEQICNTLRRLYRKDVIAAPYSFEYVAADTSGGQAKLRMFANLFDSRSIIFMESTAARLLDKMQKWGCCITDGVTSYEKRVQLDVLVDQQKFRSEYQRMKNLYKHWAKDWPERTDPQKFVFEETGIAAYLVALWKSRKFHLPYQDADKTMSFVDLGCGNGFLTHVLTMEGFEGKGIDKQQRKIWDLYGEETRVRTMNEEEEEEDRWGMRRRRTVDWVIGNHSDELTPWLPSIARRCGPSTRYFVSSTFQAPGSSSSSVAVLSGDPVLLLGLPGEVQSAGPTRIQ
eukprot:763954-Hanusia_phi.AAC.5